MAKSSIPGKRKKAQRNAPARVRHKTAKRKAKRKN
jgi:hypothetical protein